MTSTVLTVPERLALLLRDSHDSISFASAYTLNSLDNIQRPCWYVKVGDESYIYEQAEQTTSDQTYECVFIGQPFTGEDAAYNHYFEQQTREAAVAAVQYLIKHPQLQFTDDRGLVGQQYGPLPGVWWCRPESRSNIALKTGESIEQPFWGFSLTLTLRSMMLDDETIALVEDW